MADSAHVDQEHTPDLPEPWSEPDRADLRRIAEDLAAEYGESALDDRVRVMEWLGDRGLLSPLSQPDHAADERSAEYVEKHVGWLQS